MPSGSRRDQIDPRGAERYLIIPIEHAERIVKIGIAEQIIELINR